MKAGASFSLRRTLLLLALFFRVDATNPSPLYYCDGENATLPVGEP